MVDQPMLSDSQAELGTPALSLSKEDIIHDFRLCCISREASILARREVLTGKAKFGITGDGKEVPQVAMARAFRRGDFRSGYYRDQTFMLALGLTTVEELFAQLYADTKHDPFSGGRMMNSHFATALNDEEGNWLDHRSSYNVSADISSTAGQMARALGLALASKKYRSNQQLGENHFSRNGNEVAFCTIGDASTSEGVFWETMNAAGVMQVPLAVFVWDDGYGISVPTKYQTINGSISKALSGFKSGRAGEGIDLYRERAWDYPSLVSRIQAGIDKVRKEHKPALFHITEVTQPQGHSTSGSHERYKSEERLAWEKEMDCIRQMQGWILSEGLATEEELDAIRKEARQEVKEARQRAWKAFNQPAQEQQRQLLAIYRQLPQEDAAIAGLREEVEKHSHPLTSELVRNARRLRWRLEQTGLGPHEQLDEWVDRLRDTHTSSYARHLYCEGPRSALRVPVVSPRYSADAPKKNGFEILNLFFRKALERHPELYAFGEDLGKIGGVNQGFAGLQQVFGEERVFDTGIREWTIMGQAIGMAMRGLRPLGEIQYLDYLIYGLEPLNDDLATVRWRSNGQQQAPAIIRTRGHRLEGVWHAGSPLGMLVNALRGMYLCVPRNMVQAAGMYNTLLQANDPAVVIECLNGYRLKEQLPDNLGEYTVPLGAPEVLREGTDLTLVTYGSCVRVAEEACDFLAEQGINVELIDVQTLLPFDLEHRIVASLEKTNRILFLDEDVPGGATAYMLREVMETQGGYRFLDAQPRTLSAAVHRPPYGSDGDYFSKPNPEDVVEMVRKMVAE